MKIIHADKSNELTESWCAMRVNHVPRATNCLYDGVNDLSMRADLSDVTCANCLTAIVAFGKTANGALSLLHAREQLSLETRETLDDVCRHSYTRTGETARAIAAGLHALDEGVSISTRRLEVLHEWVSMVSENGVGGDRWEAWRDCVIELLRALDTRKAQP